MYASRCEGKESGGGELDQILPGPARRATQCIRKATVIRKIKELHALTGMQAILRMKSLAGAETVYKTPICDIGLNIRSRDVCCQTEATDETTPSVDFPLPKAVRKRDSGVDVNGEKKKKLVRRKIQCSTCKVAYHRDDSLWIRCSKRGCKVFLHAKCAGIICEERTDLNRISYFCESHRL